jgi:hypothetical protein
MMKKILPVLVAFLLLSLSVVAVQDKFIILKRDTVSVINWTNISVASNVSGYGNLNYLMLNGGNRPTANINWGGKTLSNSTIVLDGSGSGSGILMNGKALGFGTSSTTTPPYFSLQTGGTEKFGVTLVGGSYNVTYGLTSTTAVMTTLNLFTPPTSKWFGSGNIWTQGQVNTTKAFYENGVRVCLSNGTNCQVSAVNGTNVNLKSLLVGQTGSSKKTLDVKGTMNVTGASFVSSINYTKGITGGKLYTSPANLTVYGSNGFFMKYDSSTSGNDGSLLIKGVGADMGYPYPLTIMGAGPISYLMLTNFNRTDGYGAFFGKEYNQFSLWNYDSVPVGTVFYLGEDGDTTFTLNSTGISMILSDPRPRMPIGWNPDIRAAAKSKSSRTLYLQSGNNTQDTGVTLAALGVGRGADYWYDGSLRGLNIDLRDQGNQANMTLRTGTYTAAKTQNHVRLDYGNSSAASTKTLFNPYYQNIDLNVRGQANDGVLFVDASTNRVGVGTTAPTNLLQVNGDARITNLRIVNKINMTQTNMTDSSGTDNAVLMVDSTGKLYRLEGETDTITINSCSLDFTDGILTSSGGAGCVYG